MHGCPRIILVGAGLVPARISPSKEAGINPATTEILKESLMASKVSTCVAGECPCGLPHPVAVSTTFRIQPRAY
jgi:hypothetical protein